MRTILLIFLIPTIAFQAWSGPENKISAVDSSLVIDRFDSPISDQTPPGWHEYKFKNACRPTNYSIIPFEKAGDNGKHTYPGDHVLRAEADDGSSVIAKQMEVDLRKYPVLSWRWKIHGVIKGADGRKKSGNDFPARVYVAVRPKEGFNPLRSIVRGVAKRATGMLVPKASITFVWSNKYKPGETFPSPFSKKSMVVVVESGASHVGEWVQARVNVLEYLNRFFPGASTKIDGVGLMSDSDNTGARVVAFYDDLMFCRGGEDAVHGAGE